MTPTVRLDISIPDARALLALLGTSETFPDVLDALVEALARIPTPTDGRH